MRIKTSAIVADFHFVATLLSNKAEAPERPAKNKALIIARVSLKLIPSGCVIIGGISLLEVWLPAGPDKTDGIGDFELLKVGLSRGPKGGSSGNNVALFCALGVPPAILLFAQPPAPLAGSAEIFLY